MEIGPQKICYSLLMKKLKHLVISDTLSSLAQIILFMFSFLTIMMFLWQTLSIDFVKMNIDVIVQEIFLKVVSQLYVMKACKDHFCIRKQLLQESMTRTIDIIL